MSTISSAIPDRPRGRLAGLRGVVGARGDLQPALAEHSTDRLDPLYVEGVGTAAASAYGEIVDSPEDADLAILRLQAPYEPRATAFENFFHAGSLDFADETIAHVAEVAAVTTTIVDVFLDRPAILEPIVEVAHAVVANWGASTDALLSVLSGKVAARGKLPFDIPRSMAAVEASRPDVPFDTADPLFRFGHGLTL